MHLIESGQFIFLDLFFHSFYVIPIFKFDSFSLYGQFHSCSRVLKALTRKFRLQQEVSLYSIAKGCPPNFTGADMYALCADAWFHAAKRKVSKNQPFPLKTPCEGVISSMSRQCTLRILSLSCISYCKHCKQTCHLHCLNWFFLLQVLSSDSDSSCTDQADSIVVEYDDFMKV